MPAGARNPAPAGPRNPDPGPLDLVLEHLEVRGCRLGQTFDPDAVRELCAVHGVETLCAVIDLAAADDYASDPKRYRADVLFGRLWPTLLAKVPAPKPPAVSQAQPSAERHCPTCGLLLRVSMNPALVDDTVPLDVPVWLFPVHDCDAAIADEARRQAASGAQRWRP